MSEYMTAAEMKEFLTEGLKIQVRNARMDFDDAPHDEGDPVARRLSTRDTIRESVRLLREFQAIPQDDPRIVRLTELVPTVELFLAAIPDDGMVRVASADTFLDSLVDLAVKAAGQ